MGNLDVIRAITYCSNGSAAVGGGETPQHGLSLLLRSDMTRPITTFGQGGDSKREFGPHDLEPGGFNVMGRRGIFSRTVDKTHQGDFEYHQRVTCRRLLCVKGPLELHCLSFQARFATGAAATRRDATDCPSVQAAGSRELFAPTMQSPGVEAHGPANCPLTTHGHGTAAHHPMGKRALLHKQTMENLPCSQRYRTHRDRRVMLLRPIVEPQNRSKQTQHSVELE